MDLEQFTNDYRQKLSNPNSSERLIDPNALITIPVVVHVVHNGTPVGVGRNIPNAQIINQINILNQDFRRLNADMNQTPAAFAGLVADANIEFRLACINPNGGATNGIERINSPVANFLPVGDNNDCPVKHTDQAGLDAWPTDRYLNIWVCRLGLIGGDQLLGFATSPSNYSSSPNIDGVVVDFTAFGSGGNSVAPFDLGRTATHEIGHWLNLQHIWGGNAPSCGDSDDCGDTRNQDFFTPPGITPVFPTRVSCSNGGDMFMNYMDYSADRFMNMFTNDQRIRMRAVFADGGPRRGFIDNYFRVVNDHHGCTFSAVHVITPFCEAQTNITWQFAGPIIGSSGNQVRTVFSNSSTANGVGTVTASWGNYTTSVDVAIGYGAESSYIVPTCNNDYTTAYPMSDGANTIVCPNSGMVGELQFSGATGPALSMTLVSTNSSYVSFNANGNNFYLYMSDLYSFAQIQAVIPTICGNRTVNYYFFANIPNGPNPYFYRVSPNPASNNITVSASRTVNGTASRVINSYEYEAQVFNAFGQLMQKKKNLRGEGEVEINVANFPSNQFYIVKLISGTDVQTQRFFKQ